MALQHEVPFVEFLNQLGVGLDGLMRSRSEGLEWVDNSPENLLVGEDLLLMFPSAMLVNVVRGPREVCASMLLSGFHEEVWSVNLDEAIATWVHYVSSGKLLKATYPDRVIDVMHEDIRDRPEFVADRLGRELCVPDAKIIGDFLRQNGINSSYAPSSRLFNGNTTSLSASQKHRRLYCRKSRNLFPMWANY